MKHETTFFHKDKHNKHLFRMWFDTFF